MRTVSMVRLFANRGMRKISIHILVGALSLAAIGVPGRAEDEIAPKSTETRPDTKKELAPTASSGEARIAEPSLAQVMELLQAQGEEIAALRAALRDQQELTAKLAAKLNSASIGPGVTEPAAIAESPASPAQSDLSQRIARVETNLEDSQKTWERKLKALGPFVFSGDVRLRAEPTFGGPTDQSQDRFRERIRLRFNAEAKLNDQIKGGFALASGDLNDPISTNESLSQYDTRKPMAIDRAYAAYNPSWFRPLTVTGGKFAYPWFNTELVWDKDLNPEGAGETLAFNVPTPVLKKFSVVGFQLPFAENKNTAANNKSYYNTMVYGGQLQTFWQLGNRVKLSAYSGYYGWKYADSVALSLVSANSASPDNGLIALRSTGVQNSIATVTATNAVTGAKTIISSQFASKFGIVDSLAQVDIRTSSERWPISFIGDFAQNTRACENVRNIPAAAVFTAACDPRAKHGYWLESVVGRLEKKGDWQFGYTRMMIQREAVVGAFNYSEIFPSSNVEMHRPEVLYQLFDNITLQLNALIGRPLVAAGSLPPVQPLWERFQFDMTYKF